MRTIKRITGIIILLLLLAPFTMIMAQGPPDPPGGPGSGSGGTPIGGNAPISGGLLILIGLATAYGGKKVYYLFKEEEK